MLGGVVLHGQQPGDRRDAAAVITSARVLKRRPSP
jgi:hypothetical protein